MTTERTTTAPEAKAIARRKRGATYVGVASHRTMVRRLSAIIDAASPEQVAAGLSWYDRFYVLAATLADRHGVSTEDAAGVLAILSPRCSVGTSVVVADRLLASYVANGPDTARWVGGVLPANVERAVDHLLGDDRALAMDPGTLTPARKVRSFARNILGDGNAVTVDVWATRAAGSTLEQPSGGAYVAIAEAYRAVARRYGWSARDTQAVVWCAVRSDIDAAAELDALQWALETAPATVVADAPMASVV